jgi:hypothetical protein
MIYTDKDQLDVRFGVTFDLVEPIIANAIKACLAGNIINKKNSLCIYIIGYGTFIVGVCDGSESLLSRRIPYLKFNFFVIAGRNCFESKVYTDRHGIVFTELVIGEPDKQATFSN